MKNDVNEKENSRSVFLWRLPHTFQFSWVFLSIASNTQLVAWSIRLYGSIKRPVIASAPGHKSFDHSRSRIFRFPFLFYLVFLFLLHSDILKSIGQLIGLCVTHIHHGKANRTWPWHCPYRSFYLHATNSFNSSGLIVLWLAKWSLNCGHKMNCQTSCLACRWTKPSRSDLDYQPNIVSWQIGLSGACLIRSNNECSQIFVLTFFKHNISARIPPIR